MPNCVIVDLLYIFNTMHSFTVASNHLFVISGNSFLKVCIGIILPSLPVSILYGMVMQF